MSCHCITSEGERILCGDCEARERLLAPHLETIRKLADLLDGAIGVIDHFADPPKSCGACGTPNAQCDNDCVDAAAHAEFMQKARAAVQAHSLKKKSMQGTCGMCGHKAPVEGHPCQPTCRDIVGHGGFSVALTIEDTAKEEKTKDGA